MEPISEATPKQIEDTTKNVLHLCRLCLGKTLKMYDIGCKITCLITKIKYCTGLQLEENDGLPQSICVTCLNYVKISHRLKTISLLTDKKLRVLLRNKKISEVKDEPNETETNKKEYEDDFNDDLNSDNDTGYMQNSEDCLGNIDVKIEHIDVLPVKWSKESDQYKSTHRDSDMKKPKNSPTRKKHSSKVKSVIDNYIKKGLIKLKTGPSRGQITRNSVRSTVQKDEFKCGICSLLFKTKAGLKLHEIKEHEDKMICEVCGREYPDKTSLTMHKQCHKQDKLFACPYCDHKTRNKSNLNHHIKIHKGEKKYQCEQCTSAFFTAKCLRRHFDALHNPNRTYHTCEQCGKNYSAKYLLQRHFNRSHSSTSSCKSDSPQECEICHHVLSSRTTYRRHMRKVHEVNLPSKHPRVGVITAPE